jgi:2'-5' RNA ligase
MRLFVAVALPEDVRAQLGDLIDRLALVGDPVKWVEERNLHISVKFLGEADEAKLPAVRAALDRAVAGAAAFEAMIKGMGCFPNSKHPRVFWAGVEALPALEALASRVDLETDGVGFPSENRDWTPHVTLGRAREGHQRRRPRPGRAPAEEVTPRMAEAMAQEATFTAGPVRVDRVTLFSSQLGKGGPTYTAVHEARLGNQ